jgi:methionyl-tRNA synthetase
MEALWSYVRDINEYLTKKEPWKERDPEKQEETIGEALEALRFATHLLSAAMPKTAASIAESLGFEIRKMGDLAAGPASYRVVLGTPLFPRREKPEPNVAAAATPPAAGDARGGLAAPAPADPFAALELRVGVIEEVADHPNADALFAMTVRIGEESRSICAGLRKHLCADDLRGKKVLVIANLKPAKLRGIESRGMVLATDRRDGKVVPVDPGEASPGELVTVEGIDSRPKAKLSLDEFEKAPLFMAGGVVTYGGKPLASGSGPIRCDAEDGAKVR